MRLTRDQVLHLLEVDRRTDEPIESLTLMDLSGWRGRSSDPDHGTGLDRRRVDGLGASIRDWPRRRRAGAPDTPRATTWSAKAAIVSCFWRSSSAASSSRMSF